ncbi:hypothetical protein WN943_009474 [Citrus x changshan-huyou]
MGINFGPSDLGNRDETLYNGLLLSQNNSNLHQNPLNGNGLISSHQLNQLLHHQNNQFISQRIYQPSNIGLNGHLGLGQVVTEVRRTFVTLTPNRVQVHSFIDYSPIQNQLAFPPKEASAYGDRVVTTLAKGKTHVQDKNPGKNPNNVQNPNRKENQDVEYDGRIHSHPCKKYGPYKCPKCNGAFGTSQAFAAHMRSHYKYETSAERKRRLSARLKKRNLRLVHSTEGLTMMPQPSNEQMRKIKVEIVEEIVFGEV